MGRYCLSRSRPAAMPGFRAAASSHTSLVYGSCRAGRQSCSWQKYHAVLVVMRSTPTARSTLESRHPGSRVVVTSSFRAKRTIDEGVRKRARGSRLPSSRSSRSGKLGVLWEVDRVSGKFVAAHDLGYQFLVNVDGASGALTYQPGEHPKRASNWNSARTYQGVRNWRATPAPGTRALYIPIHQACQKALVSDKVETDNIGNFSVIVREAPLTQGPVVAVVPTRRVASSAGTDCHRFRRRGSVETSDANAAHIRSATTAGGIVVTADTDRYLYVDDAKTGKVLFQTRLPAMVHGFPVSYAVNGRSSWPCRRVGRRGTRGCECDLRVRIAGAITA